MAELVGSHVLIPGDAWTPPDEDSRGYIKKFLPPSKTYPAGRYEVVVLVSSF